MNMNDMGWMIIQGGLFALIGLIAGFHARRYVLYQKEKVTKKNISISYRWSLISLLIISALIGETSRYGTVGVEVLFYGIVMFVFLAYGFKRKF